ncbi:uncharacterized protein LOC131663049 [Phymastichus coffea]|uniref:uncharacterized protein LOC131663049 n=1 Tax=Phymastichus coffea TaxID=108790 RepID=UPI00273B4684|nr:uncharacterized protein LOC131663049 [Phymastichus coffea]
MQDLWISKCEWDEPLPAQIREQWRHYCQSLSDLPALSIDRWLSLTQQSSVQLQGFSDASSRAYAAAVYFRVDDGKGNVRISLLASKTKPSPIKTKSIPNLELCGAELLVKLVRYLQRLEFLSEIPVYLWSDSQIVLTWLKKHPCHWKTFVANRVSFIQTELPSAIWSHVPTKQNPADLATRGVLPDELGQMDLWWHGPTWLRSDSQDWPMPAKTVQALRTRTSTGESGILSRYSTLSRLTRITAWLLRPLYQLRRRKEGLTALPSKRLTTTDLEYARDALIRVSQSHAFSKDIELIKAEKTLPRCSPLRKLKPILGSDGILRVGGRLDNSNLPHSVKNPPILPRLSALSRLFVHFAHQKSLHGGPTLTASVLLRYAWILGMRPLVKSLVNKCVKCQRHKPRLAQQLMGSLPAARVTPSRPFTTSGLDYAGPFQIRTSKGRGERAYKGYIALFVCFSTKAIHLKVVSDLTSATFIAAFRRFVSRRGLCKELYSDNATTFRGADAELRAMFNAASDFYKDTASTLSNDGTSWTFIPPTTPHYGGLWEAGVKSTKHLLKRLVGEHTLTFEEFATLLA